MLKNFKTLKMVNIGSSADAWLTSFGCHLGSLRHFSNYDKIEIYI